MTSSRESKSGFSRPWAAFFALVIILGGVAVSLGFGVRLRAALERNAQSRLATSSVSVQTAVTNELGRYADAVRLSAAALSALPEPTATAFDKIAAAVGEQKLTAVRNLTFIAPGEAGMTGNWRSRGATTFSPETVSGLQEHLYTVFTHALNGKPAPAIGVDQGAAQAVVDATRLATSGAGIAISDAYVALSDSAVSKAQQQLAFDVVVPVQGFGFVSLSVAATDFVTTSLSRAAGSLLDAQLLTRAGTGTLIEVATVARGNGSGFRRTENFTAGERQWVLRTSASYQALLPNTGRTDLVVVIAGSTLAVMFGTLMYLQMSATARAEREIAAEVAEQVRQVEAQTDQGRLREALAAQEALLSGLVSPPDADPDEVDLHTMVTEAAASNPTITIKPLPPVRAKAAILRPLIDTMLADILARSRAADPVPAALPETTNPVPAAPLETTDLVSAALPETTDPVSAAPLETTDPVSAAPLETTDPVSAAPPERADPAASPKAADPASAGNGVIVRAENAGNATIRLIMESSGATISCMLPAAPAPAQPATPADISAPERP